MIVKIRRKNRSDDDGESRSGMIVIGGRNHLVLYDSFWYLLFLLSLDASGEIEHVAGGAIFLWIPYLILFLIGGCAIWASAMARHLWHRNWRRVVSLILVPITVAAFCSVAKKNGFDVSWARFKMNENEYRADLAKLPDSNVPKQMKWHWGSTGFAGSGNSETFLVYDESGALDRVKGELARGVDPTGCIPSLGCDAGNDGGDTEIGIRGLAQNFYLVTSYFN